MGRYYHLCFVVQDIEVATRELTETLGVVWSPIRDGRLGDWDYRIVFSVDGPPFLELVEGPPGSPWDASAGSRFDHLGFWADEIDADKHALAARGAPLDFDATALGRPFTYHRLDSVGARAELVDRTVQAGFVEMWAPQLSPMPSLRVDRAVADAGAPPPSGRSYAGVGACRTTLIDFLAMIDQGQATKALELFTDDASFAARGRQVRGRDAVGAFLREREAETDRHTAHVVTNDVVRSATDDEVVLSAMLLLHERDSDGRYAIHRVLDTTQTFRRGTDRWRIHDRSIRPIHPPPGGE
jgi:ketosteroid isomerase-like protein